MSESKNMITKKTILHNHLSGLDDDIVAILDKFEELVGNASSSLIPIKSSRILELNHFDHLYLRARAGNACLLGCSVLVIASISVSSPGNGVFKALLSAMMVHARSNNYLLKIENVLNPEFRMFLTREGFVFPGEEWICGSGYWSPIDVITTNELKSLPV